MYQLGFEDLKAAIEEARTVCKLVLATFDLVVLHYVLTRDQSKFEAFGFRFSQKKELYEKSLDFEHYIFFCLRRAGTILNHTVIETIVNISRNISLFQIQQIPVNSGEKLTK